MTLRLFLAAGLLVACGGSKKAPVAPVGGCDAKILEAAAKEHPDATQESCKRERENGVEIYAVILGMHDGTKQELQISLDGDILAVEEVIAVGLLPKAVTDAFATRYPDAKPEHVERVTPRGRPPIFEIAFGTNEATFAENGAFIEEKLGTNEDKD